MRTLVPSLSVFAAVILASVPWGMPVDATFVLPLCAAAMAFCWRAVPAATLPLAAAVIAGLLLDVTSGGPLGFWALMFLTAGTAGGYASRFAAVTDRSSLWLAWSGVALGLGLAGWLLASLYYLRWVDAWPIALGAALSALAFPVIHRIVLRLGRGALPKNDYLSRSPA